MRVGFKALWHGKPTRAKIRPVAPLAIVEGPRKLFKPLQKATTDDNGEWFGVAPLAVAPAKYAMDVIVQAKRNRVRISGIFDEISNYFIVDLSSRRYKRIKLPDRIPGDGYFTVRQEILTPQDLIDVSKDQVRNVSYCGACLYYLPFGPKGMCVVNGAVTKPLEIKDPANTTSQFYYPVFLHPVSPQRLARDTRRRLLAEN